MYDDEQWPCTLFPEGAAKHWLKGARVILWVIDPQVIHFLASWRKKAHSCHVNALAHQWFLTLEWQGLRGIMLDSWSEEKLSAQMAVAEVITKPLARCEIRSKSDTPQARSLFPQFWKPSARLLGLSAQVCNIFSSCRRSTSWHGLQSVGLGNWLAGCSLMGRLVFGVHVCQPMNIVITMWPIFASVSQALAAISH